MDLKPFPKEYLLSSTPLQSPGDSGYFGSGHRRYKSNVHVLSSCSPVNELTNGKNLPENFLSKYELVEEIAPQVKFENRLDFEKHVKNDSLYSLEVNELSEQEFTSSGEFYKTPSSLRQKEQRFHSDSYKVTKNAGHFFNFISEDSDIKYNLFDYELSDFKNASNCKDSECCLDSGFSSSAKYERCCIRSVSTFKQTKIDFIHELGERNCFSIISYILSCLSAKELCKASCVNKEWNKVILYDSKANSRRENFITERKIFLTGPSKENRKGVKYGPAKEHKAAFSDLSNITIDLQPVNKKVSHSMFDSFTKEAKNGKAKLLKCPRCSHASKCMNENNYVCSSCSYNFCSRCLAPIFKNHSCFKVPNKELPNIVVGSRKSKKNLRRL